MSSEEQFLCPLRSTKTLTVWAANQDVVVLCHDDSVEILKGHTDTVRAISVFEDLIASGGEDKQILVWKKDAENKWIQHSRYLHGKRIMAIQYDENGVLFFADKFGEFYRFDGKNGGVQLMFGHLSAVSAVAFGGNFLVSADRDEKIRLARYPQVEVIEAYLFGHRRYICSLALQGATLVSAGADGKVICWDLTNLEKPFILWQTKLPEGPINSAAIVGDIAYIVRSAEPSKIIALSANSQSFLEESFQIQTLAANAMGELIAVDSNSHLHILSAERSVIKLDSDVPGVPMTLIKTVHHENAEDMIFKKKRSEG